MKKILSFIAFALSGAVLSALPFNSKLSPSDLEKVNNGEIVIRNIDKYKNISIKADNYAVKTMLEQIDDLDPNYLAEIIQVRPYEGNEDLIVVTNSGVIMKMPGEQISTLKRATQGVRLINLKDDQLVSTVAIVAKEDESEGDIQTESSETSEVN